MTYYKGSALKAGNFTNSGISSRCSIGNCGEKLISSDGTTSNLQLLVPQQSILTELHDGPLGGHLGEDKMCSHLRQRFYWPGSITDIKHWCNTCPTCVARKTSAPHRRAPLHTIRSGFPKSLILWAHSQTALMVIVAF